jgi:hypothetical protein
MLPARLPPSSEFSARQAQREILLWTTKDGREIPLDEMTDDHMTNAVRVLTLWRSRARKRDSGDPVVSELADAIDRFKRILRQRRKGASRSDTSPVKKLGFQRR